MSESKKTLWGEPLEIETIRFLATAFGEGFSVTAEVVIADDSEDGAVLYSVSEANRKCDVEDIGKLTNRAIEKVTEWLEANRD